MEQAQASEPGAVYRLNVNISKTHGDSPFTLFERRLL